MDPNSSYFKQVKLLVQVLPVIAKHPFFALKGGTAINLFVRDLPRLSVDIDLAYVPVKDRDNSLWEIDAGMKLIANELGNRNGYRVTPTRLNGPKIINRLLVEYNQVRIKIEISPVLRGTVHPVEMQKVQSSVETTFGFAEIQVVSFEDLYAGKICAALDRQHPRDLFDVKLLLENEGISEALKNTFLVYLLSHPRPIAEILNPNLQPLAESFALEFENMTSQPVPLTDLEAAREQLITTIQNSLTDQDRSFLLSVKQGNENWDDFYYPQAQELPAIKWKQFNLRQMSSDAKQQALDKLAAVLNNSTEH